MSEGSNSDPLKPLNSSQGQETSSAKERKTPNYACIIGCAGTARDTFKNELSYPLSRIFLKQERVKLIAECTDEIKKQKYCVACNNEGETDDCVLCFRELYYSTVYNKSWMLQNLVDHIHKHIAKAAAIHSCTCGGICRAKAIIFNSLRDICRISFNRLVNDERKFDYIRTSELLSALYVVNYMSLADMRQLAKILDKNIGQKLFQTVASVLNRRNWPFLRVLSLSNTDDFYQEKKSIFVEILINKIRERKVPYLMRCIDAVRVRNTDRYVKSTSFAFKHGLEGPLVTDGVIYDRQRDPPGQRSVYIPPGDQFRESYRLSTFIKYPQDVPVNPRQLASSGFYYTGYKDRVKCFSCGLCVEDWQAGDDVKSVRWHRNDCKFMKNLDSGNVPVGGGGLARFLNPPSHYSSGSANLTSSPAQASPVTPTNQASASQQEAHHPRQSASIYNIVEFATIPSSYHEHFLKNLDLRKESERIRTFEHFPTDRPTVSPNDLARSGFFYLGNLDRVQCFSCAGVLRNWNYGDNVHSEHRRHFPHCRLVQGAEARNVPLSPEEQAATPRQQVVFQEPPDPSESEQRDLQNMFQCQFPVNPHMRNENTRFETFDQRWSANNVNATPRQIARAGFFYLGERDRVKCWYCNGGLQNWDRQDEPWTEHAKWFPTCEFLLQRKGPDFVHRMVSLFPNLPRPIMGGQYDVPPQDRRYQIGRARSPPPQIIDPQDEIRREDARIDEAMRSDLVSVALDLGFDRSLVRRVVERRVRDSGMYSRVEDLVADLTDMESSQQPYDSDEDIADVPQSSAAASASEPSQSMEEETTSSMQARIRELQDERKCKRCHERLADIVFVPCGHLCCCSTCAPEIQRCLVCKKKIKESIRTYMS